MLVHFKVMQSLLFTLCKFKVIIIIATLIKYKTYDYDVAHERHEILYNWKIWRMSHFNRLNLASQAWLYQQ